MSATDGAAAVAGAPPGWTPSCAFGAAEGGYIGAVEGGYIGAAEGGAVGSWAEEAQALTLRSDHAGEEQPY